MLELAEFKIERTFTFEDKDFHHRLMVLPSYSVQFTPANITALTWPGHDGPRPMRIWVCDECGWSAHGYVPYGLCCSTKPHKGSYKMRQIETTDRAICEAAGVKPEHLDYVFGQGAC